MYFALRTGLESYGTTKFINKTVTDIAPKITEANLALTSLALAFVGSM